MPATFQQPAGEGLLADPVSATELFHRAIRLHEAGDLSEAERLYQLLLEADADHAGALHNRGVLALQRGDQGLARSLIQRSLTARPENPEALQSLAELEQLRGRAEQALALRRRALALRPEWLRVRRDLIEDLITRGRFDEARLEILRFLRRHPVIPDPRNGGGGRRGIVALYGLEDPDIEIDGDAGFAFSINSGHFKINDVIDPDRHDLFRVFLADTTDLDRLLALRGNADLVVNCIADPEREGRSLGKAQALIECFGAPVINPPEEVLGTSRDQVHERLRGIPGLVFPKTTRLNAAEVAHADLADLLEHKGLRLPLIVRPVSSQTGIDMHKVESLGQLAQALDDFADREVFLIAFHDFRCPNDGLFRKMRFFVIDGRLYPEHRIVLDHWNLHSADRLKLMRLDSDLRREEFEFLEAPGTMIGNPALAALLEVPKRLNLDYFGIDFTVLPCGRVLVFEANPAMRINLDYLNAFPYQAGYIARITDAFKAMLDARSQPLAV